LGIAEAVAAKVTRALTEVPENGFQECDQKFYQLWQKFASAQGNYVLYIDVKLLRIEVFTAVTM
jgi:hypothetical protein